MHASGDSWSFNGGIGGLLVISHRLLVVGYWSSTAGGSRYRAHGNQSTQLALANENLI